MPQPKLEPHTRRRYPNAGCSEGAFVIISCAKTGGVGKGGTAARAGLGLLALLLASAIPACGNDGSASLPATTDSTETGQEHGSVNFTLDTALPVSYFVGAWTHVIPPGNARKGNDYPFAVPCQEGRVSFVSGNIAPPDWPYNANIMLFDTSQSYLGDFTLVFADSTYANDVDWVYVGWHFQRSGSQTSVTQYIKLIGSSNLVDNRVTEAVPGTWTPTGLQVGSDPDRYPDTAMYIMYASLYATDVAPSDEQLKAIYTRGAKPDPTAWAEWPLVAGDPSDISGHGRNLVVHGPVARGIPGPPF